MAYLTGRLLEVTPWPLIFFFAQSFGFFLSLVSFFRSPSPRLPRPPPSPPPRRFPSVPLFFRHYYTGSRDRRARFNKILFSLRIIVCILDISKITFTRKLERDIIVNSRCIMVDYRNWNAPSSDITSALFCIRSTDLHSVLFFVNFFLNYNSHYNIFLMKNVEGRIFREV